MEGAEVRVRDLVPGIQFESILPDEPGVITYIQRCPHPYYRGLELVIWIMPRGQVMMDALSMNQELPTEPLSINLFEFRENLGRALRLIGETPH